MPPVTITKVMPIARKALSATCFDIRMRLAAERKFGAANEKKMSTANSAMNVRSCIRLSASDPRMAVAARGCERGAHVGMLLLVARGRSAPWPSAEAATSLASLASARSTSAVTRPLLITAMRSLSAMHLVEIGGDEDDAEALRRETAHGAENLGLGADVDAAARLVHQQHLRVGHQRLADHDLLLIAARQRGDLLRGVGDLDRELAHRAAPIAASLARPRYENPRDELAAGWPWSDCRRPKESATSPSRWRSSGMSARPRRMRPATSRSRDRLAAR